MATEQLYDSIYELNLTKNCYVGKQTEEYFKSPGAGGLPFDQGLRVIARKQIKEEFREGYVSMFTPENAIREYEAGNNHLQYDFMISQNGEDYHWIRVETFLFGRGQFRPHVLLSEKHRCGKETGVAGCY